MSIKNWAVSKKSNTVISKKANTKHSSYPAISYKAFRKFLTREEARSFKRSQKSPIDYCIVNIVGSKVVR